MATVTLSQFWVWFSKGLLCFHSCSLNPAPSMWTSLGLLLANETAYGSTCSSEGHLRPAWSQLTPTKRRSRQVRRVAYMTLSWHNSETNKDQRNAPAHQLVTNIEYLLFGATEIWGSIFMQQYLLYNNSWQCMYGSLFFPQSEHTHLASTQIRKENIIVSTSGVPLLPPSNHWPPCSPPKLAMLLTSCNCGNTVILGILFLCLVLLMQYFVKIIHWVVCCCGLSILITIQYSIVWLYYTLYIDVTLDEHWVSSSLGLL